MPYDPAEDERTSARIATNTAALAEIKHRMMGCGRIQNTEYQDLSRQRAGLIAENTKLCDRMRIIKMERHAATMAITNASKQAKAERVAEVDDTKARMLLLVRQVTMLREIYRQQSVDPTRTDAVRFMANQFQDQLGKIVSGGM